MTDRIRLSCLIGLLLFSTVELRWASHGRSVPPRNDFDTFPQQVDDWSGENLPDLDPAVRKELAADNYLLRNYHHTTDPNIGLFIAYYGSQRSGDALHSPKNCLPGAGWEPIIFRNGPDRGPVGPRDLICGQSLCHRKRRRAAGCFVLVSGTRSQVRQRISGKDISGVGRDYQRSNRWSANSDNGISNVRELAVPACDVSVREGLESNFAAVLAKVRSVDANRSCEEKQQC